MKKLYSLLLTLPLFIFSGCGITTIDSSEVGVKVTQGEVSNEVLTAGWNWILNPFVSIDKYNMKVRVLEMSGTGPTKATETSIHDGAANIITDKGLAIPMDLTVLYKLKPTCAPYIRAKYGDDTQWGPAVVLANAKGVVREAVGTSSGDIYSINQNREKYAVYIKQHLENRVNETFGQQCITIDMVTVKDIHIPKEFMASIMITNQMEQESRTAELAIKKAEAEAKIEVTRLEGTAKAQLALAKSLTPEMLEWKRLENNRFALEKWNGILPTTNAGGAVPFLNIK